MEENIIFWNPWWEENFKFKNIIHREKYVKIEKLSQRKEILFIKGIRRCGKSTSMYYLIEKLLKKVPKENILYLNLDDDILQYKSLDEIYNKYLELFPNLKGTIYLFLDEIQNIDNWQRWVKNKYDSFEDIKITISGSKSHLLKNKAETLLTGRMLDVELYPFSFKEYLEFNDINLSNKISLVKNTNLIKSLFLNYLEFGGFPEIVKEKDKQFKYLILKEYFENIRNKDVINSFGIKEIKKFEKLTSVIIANVGKFYSGSKLGNLIGISSSAVNNYIDYTELVYLFIPLLKFDYSIKKQLLNPKKIYSIDTGFVNAVSFQFSKNQGRLLENLVFIELKRRNKEIYYHKIRHECDFVIREGLEITQAIQVTQSLQDEDTKKRELKGLLEACKTYNLKEALILTQDEESEETINNIKITILPIWKWLLIED